MCYFGYCFVDVQKGILIIIIIITDCFCANILEDQVQWRDKPYGLSKLVIVRQLLDNSQEVVIVVIGNTLR